VKLAIYEHKGNRFPDVLTDGEQEATERHGISRKPQSNRERRGG
jgi:hypothetical protein